MKASIITALGLAILLTAAPKEAAPVREAKITILSTMLAEKGIGEWGFSALVEANSKRLLFDTGAQPDTVLKNAQALGIDLSNVVEVVLSHSHWDHVGGLAAMRKAFAAKNSAALSKVHVGRGFFTPRTRQGKPFNPLLASRAELEASRIHFVIHDQPVELLPGVWLTGPVPRVHPEQNYPGRRFDAGLDRKAVPAVRGGAARRRPLHGDRSGLPAENACRAEPEHRGRGRGGRVLATREGHRSGAIGQVEPADPDSAQGIQD